METQQSLDAFYTARLGDMAAFHQLLDGQRGKHQVHVPMPGEMIPPVAIDFDL